jgi:hypothetical protein
VHAQRKKRQN